jgi:hypothetical protein
MSKKRKKPHVPSILLSSSNKNIAFRGLPYLAFHQIQFKNVEKNRKALRKIIVADIPAEFSEKCYHTSSADIPAIAG